MSPLYQPWQSIQLYNPHQYYVFLDFYENFICLVKKKYKSFNFQNAYSNKWWIKAIVFKLLSIKKNITWILVPLLPSVQPIIFCKISKYIPSTNSHPTIK